MPDSVTQIRKAGPVGSKRNLAILGDGFAAGDQTIYNNWVQTNVLDGLFKQDYFYEDASAWNIFRVNLISNDSGVSQRVYNEMGTPADPSDDTITSETAKDTALGMIFSGRGRTVGWNMGPIRRVGLRLRSTNGCLTITLC